MERQYNCIDTVIDGGQLTYLEGYDKDCNKVYTIDHKLKLEKAEEYFTFKYRGGYDSNVQAMNIVDKLIK